jgi:hypothetical protein
MPTTFKNLQQAVETVVTGANLNALANNALVLSSEYDNRYGQAGDGAEWATLEGYFDFAGTVAANTVIDGWLVTAPDGTNYGDGSASVTPARPIEFAFQLRGVSGAHQQRVRAVGRGGSPLIQLPPCKLKLLVRNNATGSALASNTNSFIKIGRIFRVGVVS